MRIYPAFTSFLSPPDSQKQPPKPLNSFVPHSKYYPLSQALIGGIATKIIAQTHKKSLYQSPLFITGCAYGFFSGLNKISIQSLQNSIDDATLTSRTRLITHSIGSSLSWGGSYVLLRYAYRHTEFPLFYLHPRVAIMATLGIEALNYSRQKYLNQTKTT